MKNDENTQEFYRPKIRKHKIREWLDAVIYAILFTMILFMVFWPIRIDGDSMEDNFHSNDRAIVSRAFRYLNVFDRGDIMLCRINVDGKGASGKDIDIIKRLIGLPGDHITIKDGRVYCNESLLIENYLPQQYTKGSIDITLKPDEYFVLGDNRSVSLDSRLLGPLKARQITGRIIFKWFPLNDIKCYLF